MIDIFFKLGFTLFLPTFLPWLFINIFLSFKLRHKRFEMIEAIAVSAPKKFRARAKLMLDSNFSWVFASSAAYAWYVYLMLRFVWNIPRCEILDWRESAGRSYGRYETTYKVFSHLVNVSVLGFTILMISLVLDE